MIKLFKKYTDPKIFGTKSTNEIIEEIHESFYTEVDRLLASAKIANSLSTDKQGLIDKCNRLVALGFTNTQEVKEAQAEIIRLDQLKADNEAKKTLIEAINYFSFKYPNYKFITEDSVRKICEKYNLVYGAIDRYIGTVPDKNLKHIEDFRVLEDDECYVKEEIFSSLGRQESWGKEYKNHIQFTADRAPITNADAISRMYRGTRLINMKCPLEIAAPLSDFNMTQAEVKNFKISNIEIPDPIVIKPVIFNGQKHYLIVTAWGLEASDDLVVNARHN